MAVFRNPGITAPKPEDMDPNSPCPMCDQVPEEDVHNADNDSPKTPDQTTDKGKGKSTQIDSSPPSSPPAFFTFDNDTTFNPESSSAPQEHFTRLSRLRRELTTALINSPPSDCSPEHRLQLLNRWNAQTESIEALLHRQEDGRVRDIRAQMDRNEARESAHRNDIRTLNLDWERSYYDREQQYAREYARLTGGQQAAPPSFAETGTVIERPVAEALDDDKDYDEYGNEIDAENPEKLKELHATQLEQTQEMYGRLLQREIAEEKKRVEEQCAEQLTENGEVLNQYEGLLSATQMEVDDLKRDNDDLKRENGELETQLQSLLSRQEEDGRTSVSVGTQTSTIVIMEPSMPTEVEISMPIETDTRKRSNPGAENTEEEGLPKKARNEKRR